MTKKHYEKIADAISRYTTYEGSPEYSLYYEGLIDTLIEVFESDNPLFKKNIFRKKSRPRCSRNKSCKC